MPLKTDLVELQRIQKVVQLAVLLRLLQFYEMLLETVESQLCLVVDIDLEGLRVEYRCEVV